MKRILFLVLWSIPLLGLQAQGAIEVFVDGHKYDSFQAYLASQKTAVAKTPPTGVALNNQEEEYIRKEAQELGIDVDFNKVKTFQINPKGSSDKSLHQFYVLSVEHGVIGALQDFYQNWPSSRTFTVVQGQAEPQMPHLISSEQLQTVIQQAVATSKEPKLLISEPGKVRIMALNTDEASK